MIEEVLLEVKNLKTSFAGKGAELYAVNDVSFHVKKGEIFGLIGESGCGKSATCRSIIGLIHPPGEVRGGAILYRGRNLVGLSKAEWSAIRGSEIGMIFQEPMDTLNPVMKIKEQIFDVMRDKTSKSDRERKAVEILKMVGIASPERRLESYPHEFSGGMRQRAMIAIALASKPALLLADEPTTALDVTIQSQIIGLLLELRAALDMSMILVTHDLGVAAQMCDRVAVMYAGSIMEMTDICTLFDSPRHPYTYGLMSSLPIRENKNKKLTPIRGNPPNLREVLHGCPFAPRCDFSDDKCLSILPEMKEVEPGHFSRCHRVELMANRSGIGETI